MNLPEKFLKPYSAQDTEKRIYQTWEESGYFNPDKCIEDGIADKDAAAFSVVLPPPNITGHLHLGHAYGSAIQDAYVRYHRMKGRPTLYVPGTDHAAIATQSKFEREHEKKTGKRRHEYSREEFFNLINEFALDNQLYILGQLKSLGSSLDWSRLAFTLDDEREIAVRTAFKKMYDDGLIYRKERIVNWDPKGQTTVSDDEIEYKAGKAILYTFKYSSDFPIPVATTRLETKVGDVAVAVHPDDERYQEYIGQKFIIEDFCGVKLEISVVADEGVDPEYGTGALGVTPSHSQTDWEIAEANNLPLKTVINEYAKMTDAAGPILAGKKTKEAREEVAKWLEENNLLLDTKEVEQNLSTADRTGGIIEPLPKLQWWIDVNKRFKIQDSRIKGIESDSTTTLKELMKATVANSQIKILPERFEKVYFHWIDNLRDWNISRQIIYGHRVPVWYRMGTDEICVGINAPEGENWVQDTDTLDTWFSSGLWTFSTLGWPEHTEDLRMYHPTSLLETGYDILFFWIARMILMSTYLLGEIPFETVYLHGLVRDEKGRKMSKSLNNGIDPIEMADKYSADSVRMALLVGVGPGADQNIGENKIKAYRNFGNKVWNATRFVLERLPDDYSHTNHPALSERDQQYYNQLQAISSEITEDIENYRLHLAVEKLYHYFWHEFADVIIEEAKPILDSDSKKNKQSTQWLLMEILAVTMKLLHPFMPFITEEIWTELPLPNKKLLIVETWPTID